MNVRRRLRAPCIAIGYALSWLAILVFLLHGVAHHAGMQVGSETDGRIQCCNAPDLAAAHQTNPSREGGHEQDSEGEETPHGDQHCPLCMALAGGGLDIPEQSVAICEMPALGQSVSLQDGAFAYSDNLADCISPRGPPLLSL
ncbi:MAG: DUF2946 domain-containing protein [Candidatus Sumerlaeia bacterium]